MQTQTYSRLIMLGTGPETRGSIAAVVDAYRAHGVFHRWPVDYVPVHAGGGLKEDLAATFRALRKFLGLLARHRRAVLHVHSHAHAGFWRDCLFMLIAAAARCPIILQLHGGGLDRLHDRSSGLGRAAMRFCLEHAASVVVPSESTRAWVRSITPYAHVTTIPSPVTLHKVQPVEARPNLVLFLGRLDETKGVFDLLEAVSALRASIPDVRLVCAGQGDRRGVERYAERLGIKDAVKFTGWVGPSGKRALLENTAVFVLPSYCSGLPVSMLEAMAAGVPVIASSIGGIPEVVVDGVSGFLVAPGDTATLERLLRRVLLDRQLAARVGAAARESVRLRFAPERTIPRIEELYASVGLAETARGKESDVRDSRLDRAAA